MKIDVFNMDMKPKFIEHIHLDIPKDFTIKEDALGNTMCGIENKIMVEQVEKIDNEICERIKDIAVLNGIDDVYVLDRKAIISALEKQVPKKPKIYNNIYPKDLYECSLCGCGLRANKSWKDTYCPNCGVKIDWSDIE